MAYYDYECLDCKVIFEVKHGMTETPNISCEVCNTPNCRKLISGNIVGNNGNKEVWDYGDIRKFSPKTLSSKDGKTKVKYDPSKHGYGKGIG